MWTSGAASPLRCAGAARPRCRRRRCAWRTGAGRQRDDAAAFRGGIAAADECIQGVECRVAVGGEFRLHRVGELQCAGRLAAGGDAVGP